MSHVKSLFQKIVLIGLTALLAGCGGGGGGGGSNNGGGGNNSPSGSVAGKVVDLTGAPVPGAKIYLLTGNQTQPSPAQLSSPIAATVSQGSYEVDSLPATFYTVYVLAPNGYTGSTQVFAYSSFPVTNANIVVSPTGQQATVTGRVTAGDDGRALSNAEVFLRYPTTPTANNPSGYTALSCYTFNDGTYALYNVPVYAADGTTHLQYTVAASYLTPNPQTDTRVYNTVIQSAQTFATGSNTVNLTVPLRTTTPAANTVTPTVNLIQAFTQPEQPPVLPAAAAQARPSAATSAAIYEQIRELLSPTYARVSASRRASPHLRRRAQVANQSGNYSVEMDLFFSLPSETAGQTPDSPLRSQLYGFQIDSDAAVQGNATGRFLPYDSLVEPLANFYNDTDVGTARALATAGRIYFADTPYDFGVDSIAADGVTILGQSQVVQATPLSYLNLTQPIDPNLQNLQISSLPNPPTIQWSTVDPATNAQNANIGHYYVFIYSAFPGTNTSGAAPPISGVNPNYIAAASRDQTNPLSATTNSYTVPANTLTSGQQYWVVVAATGSNNSSTSQAISVSQIVPFTVQ